MKTPYFVWSDGLVCSIGILDHHNDDGTVVVRDPMNIVFSTRQEPVLDADGKPTAQMRGRLMMDFTPWIFGVAIGEGENAWTVKPTHVLTGCRDLHEEVIKGYERERKLTGKYKRDTDEV